MNIDEQLRRQNNGRPWRDCLTRRRRRRHRFGGRSTVVRRPDGSVALYRHCTRCPASILTVQRPGEARPEPSPRLLELLESSPRLRELLARRKAV